MKFLGGGADLGAQRVLYELRPVLGLFKHVGTPTVGEHVEAASRHDHRDTGFDGRLQPIRASVAIALEQIFDDAAGTDIDHSLESARADHLLHRLVTLTLGVADHRNHPRFFKHAKRRLHRNLAEPEGADGNDRFFKDKIVPQGELDHAADGADRIGDLGL